MKIDNAVILAAGFSSRLVPLCFDKPKALLSVRGETLIERQIRQIREVGVNKIYIVTGWYAQQFEFLRSQYGVELIYNPDYQTKNNFASFYAARDILANTIITSSDLYFPHNVFQSEVEHSYYLAVYTEKTSNQRTLSLDTHGKIVGVCYGGKNSWITFGGHAVLSKEICKKLIEFINPVYHNSSCSHKYWVDFQDEHLAELPMYVKKVNFSDILEFNTLESLRQFDPSFSGVSESKSMAFICKVLQAAEIELQGFQPLIEGNQAVGCVFSFRDRLYKYIHQNMQIVEIASFDDVLQKNVLSKKGK